jgi:hypothetical protein
VFSELRTSFWFRWYWPVAGRFRTGPLSRHTTTNIDVITHLMDVAIDLVEETKRVWTVSVTRKLHDAVARP